MTRLYADSPQCRGTLGAPRMGVLAAGSGWIYPTLLVFGFRRSSKFNPITRATVGDDSEITRWLMRDYLAWRLAFGVTTPSTNTVVQPEYDDMRPPGVTNHLARMVIPDMPIRTNDDFDESIRLIDAALEDAVDRVMDCKPNAFILGISALSIWGGNQQWCDDLKRRVRAVAGFDIPVALASDAVVEGLKRHGIKRKIAVMEPYFPSIEARMQGVFGPHGYEIVRFNHMRGKSPASYSILTARDMIEAIKSVDGPDVEAIVQFGANLPMARLADEAERWLDKPVISVNVATYWHACRMNGIDDKLYGHTQLFSRF